MTSADAPTTSADAPTTNADAPTTSADELKRSFEVTPPKIMGYQYKWDINIKLPCD